LLASIKHYKKSAQKKDSKYTPLLAGSENNTYYGVASSQQDTSSENTVVASNETSPCRWTVFTLSRIGFSVLQVFLFAYGLKLLVDKKYTFSPSEGSTSDILIAYSSRILFWVNEHFFFGATFLFIVTNHGFFLGLLIDTFTCELQVIICSQRSC
jgi:hypothetical protein